MTYEISNADLRHWQARDARALVALLEDGHRNGLPPLRWTVCVGGGLVGDADQAASVAKQRAAFEAWADYLGARRWPERTDNAGVTRLQALFTWHANDRVRGVIRTDVFPAEDSERA